MKEKITFYASRGAKICEVIMPEKDQWDWVSVLDKLTSFQLEKVRQSFVNIYNRSYPNAEDAEYRITTKDIQDNHDFEEYLCDYFEIEYSGFCDCTPIEDKPVRKENALTIRQLYELAKKKNALDKPILVSHYCDDSWYSIEDVPLTEDKLVFETDDNSVTAEF